MKKNLLTILVLGLNLSLFAQFLPNDLNQILDPIKQPLNFPDIGFATIVKMSDSMIFQIPNGSNWEDSARMDFSKNAKHDVVFFGLAKNVNNQWESEMSYHMNYKYNSANVVQMFRRGLNVDDMIYINYFSYNYGSNGKISKTDLFDSIYLKSSSTWFIAPGQETFTYNSSNQLTERLLEKAKINQTTLINENKWTYKYDANGNCTEIVEYKWDEDNSIWESNDQYKYTYNTSNLMVSANYDYWNGSTWEKNEYNNLTYNGTQLTRLESFHYTQGDDGSTDYFYNSDGTLDYTELQKKAKGTSTWKNDEKSKLYYKDGELQYGLTYSWVGSAWNSKPKQKIVFRNGTASSTKPLAPSNLKVSVNKKASIFLRLSWTDNSNNEIGFIISRSTDDLTYTAIDSVNGNITEYIDSNVAEGTTYYYKVSSFNSAGASNYSNTVSETTLTIGVLNKDFETFVLYPNPCTNLVQVISPSEIIQSTIYTISGQVAITSKQNNIDVSMLENGIYIIEIKTQNGIFRNTLLKK